MNTGNQEVFGMVMGTLQRTGHHSMSYIPVNMLYVDEDFQRIETRDSKKIRSLVATWDPNQMDPLTVVPHPETATFSVVDGLGRMTAAKIKGLTHLECHVITDAPKDIKERKTYEAQIFLRQIDNVEKLKPVQMHKARLLVGDKNAIILEKAFKDYECSIVSEKGSRNPGTLGSYTRAYNIVRQSGEKGIRFVFETCIKAGYNLEPNGYSSAVFRALGNVYKTFGDVSSICSSRMAKMKPQVLKAKALAQYSERSSESAITLFLSDIIVDTLGLEKKVA